MLHEVASFEIGVLAWGMLEAVGEYSIDGILAALSAALYLELREQPMTEEERAGLKVLSDSPYELATYLLGRLRGRCEMRGMSARVFIEQTMDYIETSPVGPLPEIFDRVFDAIRDRAAAERPKMPRKCASKRKR
jgi:hypothetical protein